MAMGPTILITGGTGSIGRTMISAALLSDVTQRVIVFSRDRLKQEELARQLDDPRLELVLGDVRDVRSLTRTFRDGVDVVIHAAALRGHAACERAPHEAVSVNAIGAQNVVDAAVECGVPKVVALSSDRAVDASDVFGATKHCMESIVVRGNARARSRRTRLACVRSAPVSGSLESLARGLLSQREDGELLIGDVDGTCFWIGLDTTVALVQSAVRRMSGGEVFVPLAPSVRVSDLARSLAPDCVVRTVGLRPGERNHETLVSAREAQRAVRLADMIVIRPVEGASPGGLQGEPLPEGRAYASDTCETRLQGEALASALESLARTGVPGGRRAGDHPWAVDSHPQVGLEVAGSDGVV